MSYLLGGGGGSGDLLAANNLSDLASASTAQTNLGLGTAATAATGTASWEVGLGVIPGYNVLPDVSGLGFPTLPLHSYVASVNGDPDDPNIPTTGACPGMADSGSGSLDSATSTMWETQGHVSFAVDDPTMIYKPTGATTVPLGIDFSMTAKIGGFGTPSNWYVYTGTKQLRFYLTATGNLSINDGTGSYWDIAGGGGTGHLQEAALHTLRVIQPPGSEWVFVYWDYVAGGASYRCAISSGAGVLDDGSDKIPLTEFTSDSSTRPGYDCGTFSGTATFSLFSASFNAVYP